ADFSVFDADGELSATKTTFFKNTFIVTGQWDGWNIILLPSSTLRLCLRCDGVVANSFFSNSLRSLSVCQPHRRNTVSDDFLPLDVDLNHWPSLQRISLYGRAVVWSKFSLVFLGYVGIFREDTKLRRNGLFTSFIKDLACYPDSYPSLEEIGL
ncbi:13366_t:CDS:2, partial [Acaulospora colombiana]